MKDTPVRLFATALAALLSASIPVLAQSTNTFPSSGNTGIGTTTAQGQLDVYFTSTSFHRGISSYQFSSDNLAAYSSLFKARGTVTSPTSVANDDYIGGINIFGFDGTNFIYSAGFGARVNGTVSTGYVPQDLFFYTSAGANDYDPYTNGHVRMIINSTGSVGIGTTSPGAPVHVHTGTSQNLGLTAPVSQTLGMRLSTFNDAVSLYQPMELDASKLIINNDSTGNVGIHTINPSYTLHVNGSVAGTSAYNNLSDIRLKKDIRPVAYGLEAVMKLRPVGFNWKDQDQKWKTQHRDTKS